MIETFKILSGIYDSRVTDGLLVKNTNTKTRGHTSKLTKIRSQRELRRNFFSIRTTDAWNSLPEHVVSAPNIFCFENRLDKHWNNQPMKYSYEEHSILRTDSITCANDTMNEQEYDELTIEATACVQNLVHKDYNSTWHTSDPDFSKCFQRTVLIWFPTVFLIVYSPYQVYRNWNVKNKNQIPWSFLNVTKLVLAFVLCLIAAADLFYSVHQHLNDVTVPIVDFISPVVLCVTFIFVAYLLYFHKTHGLHTSGCLFMYWLLLTITGCIIFRSKCKELSSEDNGSEKDIFRAVTFFILYFLTLVQLVLSCIADKPSFTEQDDQGYKICPEMLVSSLSKITYGWFTSLIIEGYKKSLTKDDLWMLRPNDQSKQVVERFDRYIEKELLKIKRKCSSKLVDDDTHPQIKINDPKDIELETKEVNGQLYVEVKGTKETEKKCEPALATCLVKAFGRLCLTAAFYKLIHDVLMFLYPFLLKLLIHFTQDKLEYVWRGYFYASMLFVTALVQSLVLQLYFKYSSVLGMRLKTAIIDTVYKKTLRLSSAARRTATVGEIVNLMSVDAQRFMDLMVYFNIIWSGPLQICGALYFLWQILGPSIMAGVAFMVLLIPLNGVIANKQKLYQTQQMALKDSRIKVMNEVLNGIKVLKLYAWEPSFQKKILDIRNRELALLKRAAYLQAAGSFTWTCATYFVSLITFGVYVMSSDDNILDAEKAFVSLSLFNILKFPLAMFPNVISQLIQAYVSLKRLRRFLSNDELDPDCVESIKTSKYAIEINNGYFSWEKDAVILRRIGLQIPDGSLVAVVGAVGCGKSSLLSALLGEMNKHQGTVRVKGSTSYVSQLAWIQNESLKNNILFGRELQSDTYQSTIEACALVPDLDILPAGDETEIGEKGINLSGGQKQRVALARAVYQDTDIYLLDDPLSAVDSHVGKHIFENVLGEKGLLNKKTRILVTHGLTFLPRVDLIVVLKDGEISEMGSFNTLMDHNGPFAQFVKEHLAEELQDDQAENITSQEDLALREQLISCLENVTGSCEELQRQVSKCEERLRLTSGMSEESLHSHLTSRERLAVGSKECVVVKSNSDLQTATDEVELDDKEDGEKKKFLPPEKTANMEKLIKEEGMSTGNVKIGIFIAYARSVGIILCVLIIVFSCMNYGSQMFSNIWLSEWSNDALKPNITDKIAKRDLRLGIYGLCGILQGVFSFGGAVVLYSGSILAGRRLHRKLLQNVLRSPMSFFDSTPLGRLTNRFSKDIDTIDILLPMNLSMWLMCVFRVISVPFIIAYSTPLFLAVAVPIAIFYITVQGLSQMLKWGYGGEACQGIWHIDGKRMPSPTANTGALDMLCYLIMAKAGIVACRKLFTKFLQNILHVPVLFFDVTPAGRILNRCADDIYEIDNVIHFTVKSMLNLILQLLGTISIIAYTTVEILLVVPPLAVIYLVIQRFYVATSRQLKRLESVSRSPVYSHFGETITGVSTIRAFSQMERFIEHSERKVDENHMFYYPTIIANRWLAVRLELVGNLIVFFAAVFAVVGRDSLSPGLVGLSITYALSVTQTLNWMVRMTTELETNIVCVERVKEYSETPTEAPWIIEDGQPEQSWPQHGEVRFDNYGTRYREGLDLVLKNIDCTVNPEEKIGIVGRTGAGKSSLTVALFRIIEAAEGRIVIDGVDISKIGLHDLRSKLTIIPQDPVLFAGTLRTNLDPFETYCDDAIWKALENAHLKSYIESLDEGLEYECGEGGEGLSVGQRQLLCLARALLRKTKILVLDEATAAVDQETDNRIQDTIRTEFKDCTILTIAHRLNTVMDYTRIMVLDQGNIIEFDTPNNLLQDTNSAFYSMARDAGLV